MSDSPWKPMQELTTDECGIVIVRESGALVHFPDEAALHYVFTSDLAWCYAHELDPPTNPVKPKPKVGEVWKADGMHWLCVIASKGELRMQSQATVRTTYGLDEFLRYNGSARLVLPAPGDSSND